MKTALVHGGLFLATVASTFAAFFFMWSEDVLSAALFSFSVMLILGAHEMGHFLLARHHHVETSWPYFIPLPPPLGLFGTMGAVIRIKGRIPTRNALVDIGAAGPLAGLVVAVPLMLAGLYLSHTGPAPVGLVEESFPASQSLWVAAPEWWAELQAWLQGLPSPVHATPDVGFVFGDNLATWAMARLVFGELPKGHELYAHPVFLAAWFGFLVTMLNLFPLGQLDGGHISYALFGDGARRIGVAMAALMFGAALFFSASWLVWMVVTSAFVGFRHPPVVFSDAPLSSGRRFVAALSFIAFIACVMPVPLSMGGVP